MLEKVTPKGVIKYRMPNVVEGYEFLGMISGNEKNLFKIKAEYIKNLSSLIDLNGLYATYEDALNDKDLFKPLGDIADEVLTDITKALEKKD